MLLGRTLRGRLKARWAAAGALAFLVIVPTVSARPLPSLDGVSAKAPPPATGPYKWATLLCKFSNIPDEPHDLAWFDGLMGMEYPGLGHYWGEQSFGQLDLQGSQAYGWFTLPGTRSSYGVFPEMDFQRLADDCVQSAETQVNFPDFQGINLMFNSTLDIASGGPLDLEADGQRRTYGVTWQGAPSSPGCQCGNAGFDWQAVVASEMQHAFGVLWHSSGPYENTFDSHWDVGSSPGASHMQQCPVNHAAYGCIGQHTIAYHKYVLGWIPDARQFDAPKGTTTVTLRPLDTMPASDFLWSKVPIAGSATRFYSVEVRRQEGYDVALPTASAVIIHRINTTLADRKAQVVDATNDGNPNDAGATWNAGETYADPVAEVSIEVLAGPALDGSYQVRITAPAAASTAASILDASVREGDRGTKTMRFEVVLSPAPLEPVTLGYSTDSGRAKSRKDFVSSSGDLRFAAGQRSKTVKVRVKGDTLVEPNETFSMVLSAGPDVELVDRIAKGKIRDND